MSKYIVINTLVLKDIVRLQHRHIAILIPDPRREAQRCGTLLVARLSTLTPHYMTRDWKDLIHTYKAHQILFHNRLSFGGCANFDLSVSTPQPNPTSTE